MYEIDKEKFGTFVAALRKERGLTQKELADKLFVSNKAVSKWETAVSLPDVTLLIPLADALGISVTELLQCRQMEPEAPMDTARVEKLVQSVLRYPEEDRFAGTRHRRGWVYALCVLIAAAEAAALHFGGYPVQSWSDSLQLAYLFGILFGAYFLLLIKPLPPYHDQYRVTGMHQGLLRMNVPGLAFHNRNWPHIVRVGQIWSMGILVGYPAVYGVMTLLFPSFWTAWERYVALVWMLGGLFLPMYLVGKKYE